MSLQEEMGYGRYRIEITLYDERMNPPDAFTLRQDLPAGEGVFAIRLTREMPDGQSPPGLATARETNRGWRGVQAK